MPGDQRRWARLSQSAQGWLVSPELADFVDLVAGQIGFVICFVRGRLFVPALWPVCELIGSVYPLL